MSDDLDLIDRLAAALSTSEGALCGEFHGDTWPDCDHPAHDPVRRLLEEAKQRVSSRDSQGA